MEIRLGINNIEHNADSQGKLKNEDVLVSKEINI